VGGDGNVAVVGGDGAVEMLRDQSGGGLLIVVASTRGQWGCSW